MNKTVIAWALAAVSLTGCTFFGQPDDAKPTSLAVSCEASSLNGPGRQTQCKATVTMSNGNTQDQTTMSQWSSSDQTVATVSSGGLVTSGTPGMTTIGAKFSDVSGSASLSVFNPPPLR